MRKIVIIKGEEKLYFDSIKEASVELNISLHHIKNALARGSKAEGYNVEYYEATDELIEQSVRLAKQKQKFQDTNRIERKSFREYARVENALQEYNQEIKSILDKYNFSKYFKVHESDNVNSVGVINLSDTHFNELVDLPHNKYDFNVASKRLKLLADKSIQYFKTNNIKNILIAVTGDLLNSNRRLDELLNQATNRANASMLGVMLLLQFIKHLNQHFNITYATVSGNESRIEKEMGWSDIMATDSFDFTIHNILKYMLRESEGITFIQGDAKELVVNVAGSNLLLLHNENLKGDLAKGVQQIKGKYADRGVLIDYVIFGHIHMAFVSDMFSRSSSLVGDNDYSSKALQLSGRASHNIIIFDELKHRDVIKVDLQHTDHIEGYNIIKELESYNAKSCDKVKNNHTIFKVVI